MGENKVEIKERIKEILRSTGDSQADMCRKTGLEKSALSNYISGYRIPRQDKISAIADAYSINPAWLLGYDVTKFRKSASDQAKEDFELLEKWHNLTPSQQTLIMGLIDEYQNK